VENGRGGEIRTHDLYVPNVALYQAKLRPDIFVPPLSTAESLKEPHRHRRRKQKIGACAATHDFSPVQFTEWRK
jgi:hypothetical protein